MKHEPGARHEIRGSGFGDGIACFIRLFVEDCFFRQAGFDEACGGS
ncbi:hypothetical protein [Prosthecobacter sp.]